MRKPSKGRNVQTGQKEKGHITRVKGGKGWSLNEWGGLRAEDSLKKESMKKKTWEWHEIHLANWGCANGGEPGNVVHGFSSV